MTWRVLIPALMISAAAFAQTPSEEAAEPGPGAGQAQPCVSGADSGLLEDGTLPDGTTPVPCEEPESAEAQAAAEELPEALEEDPFIEATADEVFEPDDEISEDYPVPLPSDI